MDISGRTAIVTGAASGIGLGIATALAEAGANVVMADIQKDAVEQAAHGLSGTNKRVMPVRIDVTQEQSVIDALAEAERNFGKLHIACNNAGVPMHGTRTGRRAARPTGVRASASTSGAIIHGIRHFVPAILKHGEDGHIVNTASVAGLQNRRGTNQGPYSMSKYAALSLSEALEHELEGTNVGVSVLCPGPIDTNIARGAHNRPDHLGGPQVRPTDEAVWRSAWHDRYRPQAGRRAGDRRDPQQDLLRLRQRRAGRGDQGPAPPHRGGARDPVGDAVLARRAGDQSCPAGVADPAHRSDPARGGLSRA